jgi:hypothetical protein
MFWICIFFLIDILDLYLGLLILYQKGPKILSFFFFFEKIKTCPKISLKSKLKRGFQTEGYKHNNR